jgi:hypothetical protein
MANDCLLSNQVFRNPFQNESSKAVRVSVEDVNGLHCARWKEIVAWKMA